MSESGFLGFMDGQDEMTELSYKKKHIPTESTQMPAVRFGTRRSYRENVWNRMYRICGWAG